MPRSPMQSDFVVHYEQPPIDEIVLPAGANAVDLPRAIVRTNEASAGATKLVMTITFIMLAVLALMCAIGPHIPSGE